MCLNQFSQYEIIPWLRREKYSMPGRGKPRADAKSSKRKVKAKTPWSPDNGKANKRRDDRGSKDDDEMVEIVQLAGDDETTDFATNSTGNQTGDCVDFGLLINPRNDNNVTISQKPAPQALVSPSLDVFNVIRGGGEELSYMHVPRVIRSKIWEHQFINLSVLFKGNAEHENLTQGSLIRLNEQGLLETYSKPFNEKLDTISRWTDAFLIFSSIYLLKFPQSGGDLMQYMSTVREASQIYGGFAWRVYDANLG